MKTYYILYCPLHVKYSANIEAHKTAGSIIVELNSSRYYNLRMSKWMFLHLKMNRALLDQFTSLGYQCKKISKEEFFIYIL